MTDDGWRVFEPDRDDPVAYDREALEYLVRRFHRPIELAIDTIRAQRFTFPTMQELHDGNLDVELVYRQCLPAAGIAVRLGLPVEDTARFLVLFATCQTLILNNVDRHLDLSASYTLRDPTALLRDVHSVTCYAIAELYRGMATAAPSAGAALREMAGVSLEIIQSMYDNYANRFRAEHLTSPHLVMEAYHDPARSRHLGSGFYSSSVLGLHAYFRLSPPPGLDGILRDMRRLRQRVDELSDLFEDTATGLLSYPVASLLSMPGHRVRAAGIVADMWRRARQLLASTGSDAGRAHAALAGDHMLLQGNARLIELLADSGVTTTCYREAAELWQSIRRRIREELDPSIGEIVCVVVDLKRAFLERLSRAGWADTHPGHTFNAIRSAITGTDNDG